MDLEALIFEPTKAACTTVAAGVAAFGRTLSAIRNAAVPVIAAIDGTVLGGGVGIAAACDLVLATERSTFGLPESLMGLIPAVVLPTLLHRMPAQKARLFALTAHTRSAAEMETLGLVDRRVSDERLEPAVRCAVRALGRARPAAVAVWKRLCATAASVSFEEGLKLGVAETTRMLSQPEIVDTVREFLCRYREGETPWR
jgi:enoyl-CoA hydratase/carnithine racemase